MHTVPRASSTRALAKPLSVQPGWLGGTIRLVPSTSEFLVSYGSTYHVPAMLAEVLHYLQPDRGGVYLDGTLGGGGHTHALLDASPDVRVIGIDRDPEALAESTKRLARHGERFHAIRSPFAEAVAASGIEPGTLAGALLDLGISSHQIDHESRGFTFRSGAPLDMRMEGSSASQTAADLLNELELEDLATIFYRFGEEKRSRHMARIVGEMRERRRFAISDDLVETVDRAIPRATAQDRARIFQALRIAVNGEVEQIEAALPRLRDALAPGGVIVVLSYHSLEDRIVKEAFREWSRDCVCPPGLPICYCRGKALGTTLTRKPVMATPEEVQSNPRARSARLRAWRKE